MARGKIYVIGCIEDYCRAIYNVLLNGKIGDTYNVGGGEEKTNLEVVNNICDILDDIYPSENLKSYKELIKFVEDRPGHDFRYAIDYSKLKMNYHGSQKKVLILV